MTNNLCVSPCDILSPVISTVDTSTLQPLFTLREKELLYLADQYSSRSRMNLKRLDVHGAIATASRDYFLNTTTLKCFALHAPSAGMWASRAVHPAVCIKLPANLPLQSVICNLLKHPQSVNTTWISICRHNTSSYTRTHTFAGLIFWTGVLCSAGFRHQQVNKRFCSTSPAVCRGPDPRCVLKTYNRY